MPDLSRRSWLLNTGLTAAASLSACATSASSSAERIRPGDLRLRPTLSFNENSYGPSPHVASAIRANLDQLQLYVDQTEVDALARDIAEHERVKPDQVVVGEVLAPLGVQLAASRQGGGEFVYATPGYTELIDAGAALGGVGRPVPLNDRLENDLPALTAAVGPKTLAVSLVNPHNPSGTVNDATAFDIFIREVSSRVLVIVDEAYLEFDDLERRSAIHHTRDGANVLVYRTFAKAYGLAGLTIGYAVAPTPIVTKLRAAGVGAPHTLSRLSLVAAAAALNDQAYLADVARKVRANRTLVQSALDALGVRHSDSRGNFVFFRSPTPADQARVQFADRGIIVGRSFPPLSDWIRITIGNEQEAKETIGALKEIYGQN